MYPSFESNGKGVSFAQPSRRVNQSFSSEKNHREEVEMRYTGKERMTMGVMERSNPPRARLRQGLGTTAMFLHLCIPAVDIDNIGFVVFDKPSAEYFPLVIPSHKLSMIARIEKSCRLM